MKAVADASEAANVFEMSAPKSTTPTSSSTPTTPISTAASSAAAAAAAAAISAAPIIEGPLPDGWIETLTPTGRYYYHVASRISRWERPSGDTAERISCRLQADAAETERRKTERHAELAAAEMAAVSARDEADALRAIIVPAVVLWAEKLGYTGLKALRRTVKGGDTNAPKRAAAALLGSLAAVPVARWEQLIDKAPLVLPPGWNPCGRLSSDVIKEKDMKKSYLLAVRALHPDKTAALDIDLRIAGEEVFTLIKSVWEAYISQNDNSFLIPSQVIPE